MTTSDVLSVARCCCGAVNTDPPDPNDPPVGAPWMVFDATFQEARRNLDCENSTTVTDGVVFLDHVWIRFNSYSQNPVKWWEDFAIITAGWNNAQATAMANSANLQVHLKYVTDGGCARRQVLNDGDIGNSSPLETDIQVLSFPEAMGTLTDTTQIATATFDETITFKQGNLVTDGVESRAVHPSQTLWLDVTTLAQLAIDSDSWFPYGNNKNNFAVLLRKTWPKVTNSWDNDTDGSFDEFKLFNSATDYFDLEVRI